MKKPEMRVEADAAGVIAGTVRDFSGAAAAGVTVTLKHAHRCRLRFRTTTAVDGSYRFANLLPGVYVLNFHRPEGRH